jgi:hypothetical protein
MKFKAFEIYMDFGDFNTSMIAIEQKADRKVNEWLSANPKARVEHFSQSLVELNHAVVYQVGLVYSDE